ncbi:MAG TPA: tripartite tricarboxylate transporter substrate binding protein [Arsenicitalea sp.]|jgi:tripartite-type tricarboxylate transporter receptor subunit TctC|nr:tripartite tricarboxylate transporter substrate binding protein [Arsenicitalea sp.]
MIKRKLLGLAFMLGLSAVVGTAPLQQAAAADYPTKPIQLVVPFTAGGGTDLVSRVVAAYLTNKWGRAVNVVNRPGAGGATGTNDVLKGNTDGYTVLAHNGSSTEALIAGNTNLPFSIKDYRFVATVVNEPFGFLVKADSPFKTLKDLSDWVKANPGQLTFGSTGPTSIQTFSVIQWLDSIGADFSQARLVPSNGGGELLPQIAGGHVILGVQDVTGATPLIKAGKLKLLAVTGAQRTPLFPDVPTTAEEGAAGVTTHFWSGVSLPVGTPDAIVEKWQSSIKDMMSDPEFQAKMKALNAQPGFMDSAAFEQTVKHDMADYQKIVADKGLLK